MASDTPGVLVTSSNAIVKCHDENPDCFCDHPTCLHAVGFELYSKLTASMGAPQRRALAYSSTLHKPALHHYIITSSLTKTLHKAFHE